MKIQKRSMYNALMHHVSSTKVLMRAICVATPSACLAFCLKIMDGAGMLPDRMSGFDILNNSAAYSGFTATLSFMIVFRSSQAYSRFWEGCTLGHKMFGEWLDAGSSALAFAKRSKKAREETEAFCESLLRLLSLLHACSIAALRDLDGLDLELIDPDGIDDDALNGLRDVSSPEVVAYQWTIQLLTENVELGIIAAPPPIVSRLFHQLANGFVAYHDAAKFVNVNMPIAYQTMTYVLLCAHWCITPFVICMWTEWKTWVFMFTFLQVFAVWALLFIAIEIEYPFGKGLDNYAAEQMQRDFNDQLLLMIHPLTQQSPISGTVADATRKIISTRHVEMDLHGHRDHRASKVDKKSSDPTHVVELFPEPRASGTSGSPRAFASSTSAMGDSLHWSPLPLPDVAPKLNADGAPAQALPADTADTTAQNTESSKLLELAPKLNANVTPAQALSAGSSNTIIVNLPSSNPVDMSAGPASTHSLLSGRRSVYLPKSSQANAAGKRAVNASDKQAGLWMEDGLARKVGIESPPKDIAESNAEFAKGLATTPILQHRVADGIVKI